MKLRLILAILLPFAAGVSQWLLWDYMAPYAWLLFFPAAYLSAWIGGFWGGLSATILSALLVWYVFMPPRFSLALESPTAALPIVVFLIMGALFAYFFERLRRAQARGETRFEATFEQAAVGLALVGLDGRWLRVNHKLCEIVGYDRAELLGLTFQAITHPDDLAPDLEYVRRLLAGDIANYSMEKRYLRKDASPVWIKLTVSLVRNRDGSPDYFISVLEDIQTRREAEAGAIESEERYRELVESANSVILRWAPDGRITFFNAFAQRLFGWQADEAIGQPVSMLVPAQDSTGVDLTGLVSDIVSHPEHYHNNINENRCRDGRRVWMNWTNRVLRDAQGQVVGILAVGNDITQQKRAEEDLRQRNEELERFNQAAVGRELDMIALKHQVNDLSRQLGRQPPFDLSFAQTAQSPAGNPLP
jgi:PAS domain S-box-containing protein